MKGGMTKTMPRVRLIARRGWRRGLAGGHWSVVGTFGRPRQSSDNGVCVCGGGGSWRIKHGEEEAPPSASVGWPASSLAPNQRCLPELLEWGTTTEIEQKLRLRQAIRTPLIFLLYKVRVVMYFQKRGRGRRNESKHLHFNDSCRPLNPGA